MTVSYTGKVANSRMCAFTRLLGYWKGSIYKLMYKEMLIFMALYTMLSLVYRLALSPTQKWLFEQICLHCEAFTNLIPLSFVLGFYVSIVVTRWWTQFNHIPWPDVCMMYVSTMMEGFDERSRLFRRTIMRYLTLSSLLVFQKTSVSVKKRFPTEDHLIEADISPVVYPIKSSFSPQPIEQTLSQYRRHVAVKSCFSVAPSPSFTRFSSCCAVVLENGILTHEEAKLMDEVSTPHGKWWVPFHWITNIVADARNEGIIRDEFSYQYIMKELMIYRGNLGMLINYDWISIPLVYTQVTTLAVYTFFLGCLFGRQFLDPSQNYPGHTADLYVPVFTILQFFFYMGWIKVAEQLINPFGEDEDDFEMNWIIDRNFQISMLVVDELYMVYPRVDRDIYWGEPPPDNLPYTLSSVKKMRDAFIGSTAHLSVPEEEMKVVAPMETINENQAHVFMSQADMPKSSHATSPQSSPEKARKLHHSLLSKLYSSNSISSRTHLGSQVRLERSGSDATARPLLHTPRVPRLARPSSVAPDSVGSGLDRVEYWLSSGRIPRSRRTTECEASEQTDTAVNTPHSEVVDSVLDANKHRQDTADTLNQLMSRSPSVQEQKASDLPKCDVAVTIDPEVPKPAVTTSVEKNVPQNLSAAGGLSSNDATTSSDSLSTIYEYSQSNQSTVNSMQQLLTAEVTMSGHHTSV